MRVRADQVIDRDVELLVRVVRMGADRAIDVRKALRDRQHLGVPLRTRVEIVTMRADAGRLRARHHGVELVREIRKIEMAMAVDQHGQHRSAASGRLAAARHSAGTPALGAGSVAPAAIRWAPPSAAKSRSSAGTASRSSSFAADAGMNGCARIATCRITSAVT